MRYGSAAVQTAAPGGIFIYPIPHKGAGDDDSLLDIDRA